LVHQPPSDSNRGAGRKPWVRAVTYNSPRPHFIRPTLHPVRRIEACSAGGGDEACPVYDEDLPVAVDAACVYECGGPTRDERRRTIKSHEWRLSDAAGACVGVRTLPNDQVYAVCRCSACVVMWDALSSRPPLPVRRVRNWARCAVAGWRQCTVCPVHIRVYSSGILPASMACCIALGLYVQACSAQLPGPKRIQGMRSDTLSHSRCCKVACM
jgi:hypothetical protein